MESAELITRVTIWISIAAYVIGMVAFAFGRKPTSDSIARVAWTIACAALGVHYICAFQFFHHWSHQSAYLETARQTEEVFKINWGGGLFINYGLLVLWVLDVGWWWLAGLNSYRQRPRSLVLSWHAILIFIILNATVVFKTGLLRWVGVLVTLILFLSWITVMKQRRTALAVSAH